MLRIAQIESAHLEQVAQIEQLCFSQPWSQKSLELLLGENAVGLVAIEDGCVQGYVGMTFVLDEGQITNLAVHPNARRRGIGRMLMDALRTLSVEKGIAYLSLEVRESNIAARTLYAGCGWKECGLRKNFYSHPQENAVIMICELL